MRNLTLRPTGHHVPGILKARVFPDEPKRDPISGSAVGRTEDGQFVFAQWPIQSRQTRAITAWLAPQFQKHRFASGPRMNGFAPVNEMFGYSAPAAVRARYACALSGFDKKNPKIGAALRKLVAGAVVETRSVIPDEFTEFERRVHSMIHPDYWLGGTPYTSGVINKQSILPYHHDGTNVKDAISIQVNLRRDATGGALHLPEYDEWLANDDDTIVVFRGGSLLHGVTPIHLQTTDAYRYSIVFYAKRSCSRCGPLADEPARAARYQQEVLRRRIDPDEQDESLA